MKAVNKQLVLGLVCVLAGEAAWSDVTIYSGRSGKVKVDLSRAQEVNGHAMVEIPPFPLECDKELKVFLDGEVLFSTEGDAHFDWQPQTLGEHVLSCQVEGQTVATQTVMVNSLAFEVAKGPNPPTGADPTFSVTPQMRNFGPEGGGAAIVVSGSGTWEAAVSDEWITLNATNGAVGYPCAYMVEATTNVEKRTGYVYVCGHVHTVIQEGVAGNISPENATWENKGGSKLITVTAADGVAWLAQANCNWINVSPVRGMGMERVTYTVAPLNEVDTRQGTLAVAGKTFTVFQYGRRMKLVPTKATYDYFAHEIPIMVDALDFTEWTVVPNESWISVVDRNSGKGEALVTIALEENPNWKARTGTVSIGTETFAVTQQGRTALEFSINPTNATVSRDGANGRIAVTATPELPWTAESQTSWLMLDEPSASGEGGGNAMYNVAPNPTVYNRTGTIVVVPGDESLAVQTHTVTQSAALASLSMDSYEFAAEGARCEVRVSVSDIVEWQIENSNDWLTVVGPTNWVGPGTVTLQAAANDTVDSKFGSVTIAGKRFSVLQNGIGVDVEYTTKLFGPDGGSDSISIHTEEQLSWIATASDPTWITIFQGDTGRGDGKIVYIVSPFVKTNEARIGSITVGGKVVYISQRAYELNINPVEAWVEGDKGAGEFEVSADNGDIWSAIATAPWITLVEGSDAGMGTGSVRFLYSNNDTGETRAGKIIVAGEIFTLRQRMRVPAFPDVEDEENMAKVLSLATDMRLGERIANVEEYDAFRAWIAEKGLDPQEVKASERAWPSYLLGTDALLENEPKIQIVGYSSGEGAEKERAAGFSWEIRVTIHDGETAVDVDSDKVASMFEATRQIGDWTKSSLLPLSAKAKGRDGDVLLFEVSVSEAAPGAILRLGRGIAVAKYLVVDMSGGPYAASWPVEYLDWEPEGGFNTDEYKTTKLVLRRIEAGTFKMGSPQDELGRSENEDLHAVTLSKPYWMGVFEVTQKQWELAMGDNPARHVGNKRPVECVSYEAVRGSNAGTNWPANNAVDATSFMGVLRAKTGLAFDLPTEAQWEYACRAGTTTALNSGKNLETEDAAWGDVESPNMDEVGQYDNRYAFHSEAGTHLPNAWGLYDMHGNVWEWCLDWYEESLGTGAATDPKGSQTPTYRVNRGGSWFYGPSYCRSSFRGHYRNYPSFYHGDLGLRVACGMEE